MAAKRCAPTTSWSCSRDIGVQSRALDRPMKRRSKLHIRRLNNEPAWFPVENPQPGQRLDIWMMRGFDFVRATIWYHPDGWYQLDFQTRQH